MKLAIFGSTGRTGKHIVTLALKQGHQVTAFARDAGKLGLVHTKLRVVEGGVRTAEPVSAAVIGADAVICALSPVKGGPKNVMELGAINIIAAMKEHGVKRIIFSTGAGVLSPDDKPTLMSKIMGVLLKKTAGNVLDDSLRAVEEIQKSGLDWTIARAPMLKDGEVNGAYQAGYVGKGMTRSLTRGNFADFMLKQVSDSTYLHKMPVVSDA